MLPQYDALMVLPEKPQCLMTGVLAVCYSLHYTHICSCPTSLILWDNLAKMRRNGDKGPISLLSYNNKLFSAATKLKIVTPNVVGLSSKNLVG